MNSISGKEYIKSNKQWLSQGTTAPKLINHTYQYLIKGLPP